MQSTGTGTCNKVLVAKKKIFFCCWLLRRCTAGVASTAYITKHSKTNKLQSVTGSALQQINRYLEMDDEDDDCLAFWRRNWVNLNKLVYPAIRALSVPAASSAVERVFSHGGVILRPHRGRMSNKLLPVSNFVYLKCNKTLMPYWLTDRWDRTGGVSPHSVFEVYWCSNCSFFTQYYERSYNFYFVQLQCNLVPIIYAQYLYLYWYLKVMYWYWYWYMDHWYWYWYLFVEYLIQNWWLTFRMQSPDFLTFRHVSTISSVSPSAVAGPRLWTVWPHS